LFINPLTDSSRPSVYKKTGAYQLLVHNINFSNPRQMSIGIFQMPAGSSNTDDKFEFGFGRFDDKKRTSFKAEFQIQNHKYEISSNFKAVPSS
jgi:hypothetical protein